MFVCIRKYYESILDLHEYYIVSVIQLYRSDIGSDNVQSRTKIYRLCNYTFRVRTCWEQKYTIENKNVQEQNLQQMLHRNNKLVWT